MHATQLLGTIASVLVAGGAALFGVLTGATMIDQDPQAALARAPWLAGGLITLVVGLLLQIGGWLGFNKRHETGGAALGAGILATGVVVASYVLQATDPVVHMILGAALMVTLGLHAWTSRKALGDAMFLGRTADGFAGIARTCLLLAVIGLGGLMFAFARQITVPDGVAVALFAMGFGGYAVGQLSLAGVFAAEEIEAEEIEAEAA